MLPERYVIVSKYSSAELYNRVNHPRDYRYPAIRSGEVLIFADAVWGVFYAIRRGWFAYDNAFINELLLERIGTQILPTQDQTFLQGVFANVLDDWSCAVKAAACYRLGKDPQQYLETVGEPLAPSLGY